MQSSHLLSERFASELWEIQIKLLKLNKQIVAFSTWFLAKNMPSSVGTDINERQLFIDGAGKYENIRITKNVFILGIAFMVHFTAFHGMANLQSTVNSDAALGAYTLAAIYGSLIVSNIFLPVTVIRCDEKIKSGWGWWLITILFQMARLQVDNRFVIPILHTIHWCSVLSTILYTSSGRFGRRIWWRSVMVRKMHVPNGHLRSIQCNQKRWNQIGSDNRSIFRAVLHFLPARSSVG